MERSATVQRATFDASGAARVIQKLGGAAAGLPAASPAKGHGSPRPPLVGDARHGDALDKARAYCLKRSALACRRFEASGVNTPERKRGLILFWLLVALVALGVAVRRHAVADARRAEEHPRLWDGPRHSLADGGLWSAEAEGARVALAALDVIEGGGKGKGVGRQSRRHRIKHAAKRAAKHAFRRAKSAAPAAWRASANADGDEGTPTSATTSTTTSTTTTTTSVSKHELKKREMRQKKREKEAAKQARERARRKAKAAQRPGDEAGRAEGSASAPQDLAALAALARDLTEQKARRAAEGDGADAGEPLGEGDSSDADDVEEDAEEEWKLLINDASLNALGLDGVGKEGAASVVSRRLDAGSAKPPLLPGHLEEENKEASRAEIAEGGLTPWLRSIGFATTEK